MEGRRCGVVVDGEVDGSEEGGAEDEVTSIDIGGGYCR